MSPVPWANPSREGVLALVMLLGLAKLLGLPLWAGAFVLLRASPRLDRRAA